METEAQLKLGGTREEKLQARGTRRVPKNWLQDQESQTLSQDSVKSTLDLPGYTGVQHWLLPTAEESDF